MRNHVRLPQIAVVALLAAAGLGILKSADEKQYTPLDKGYYLTAQDGIWLRPGIHLDILNIGIPADRKPVVTFRLSDDGGQSLDRLGRITPGVVSTNFILAYIPADEDQYRNYITRVVTSTVTKVSVNQPTRDSTGTYTELGDGTYTYTFGATLPQDYDRTTTHTIGAYATRDMREFGLSLYVVNSLKDFVPDGRPVTRVREVVATENCNQCHNPLAVHGSGARRDVRLCVLCHTPQNADPNSGNSLDLKVFIHKIHMGENLPSVKAGRPFYIGTSPAAGANFSDVTFPRDIRNCTTCHKNAVNAEHYKEMPDGDACGSCHDDVNFDTGENHPSGPAPDEDSCVKCHAPESGSEYDASIVGAHTVPYRSKQLRYPKFVIIGVSNTGPGQSPTVQFKITDKNNAAIAPADMARIALRLAGPTADYRWYLLESAAKAGFANGVATYTFTGTLPSDASGTYSVGIEGYVNTKLNPGTKKELVYRDAGDNVLKLFAVSGPLTPRRTVVELSRCNKCHDKLQLHGNNRNDPQYCVGCHNPTMTDGARRPAAEGAAQSIHFKVMIHRIHTGEDLTSDFTIWGGSPATFNNVTFPGDRRDCTTCHAGSSYTLPLALGLLASSTPRWYWTPTQPVAAACLACHDSLVAAAHAAVNTSSLGESCNVCHKEGAEFAVTRLHAR